MEGILIKDTPTTTGWSIVVGCTRNQVLGKSYILTQSPSLIDCYIFVTEAAGIHLLTRLGLSFTSSSLLLSSRLFWSKLQVSWWLLLSASFGELGAGERRDVVECGRDISTHSDSICRVLHLISACSCMGLVCTWSCRRGVCKSLCLPCLPIKPRGQQKCSSGAFVLNLMFVPFQECLFCVLSLVFRLELSWAITGWWMEPITRPVYLLGRAPHGVAASSS